MPKINLNISRKVFNDVYFPFLQDDTHTQIFFGGSSSGKSYFLAQRCILDMLAGGHNYLIVRNVALTVRKSVFNEICKAISFFKVGSYFNINKTDLVITCFNGYQIMMAGLDDSEKIKSITPSKGVITDIWCEEATEDDYNSIKQLYKRLRGASKVKKRVILSFNPILQTHWLYKEYFGKWDDKKTLYCNNDLVILKTTYKDNKFLTPEDIYQLENEKDEYYRNVYTLGNWGVLGGVIFKNWRVEDLSDIKDTFDTFKNGGDFGFADDPATCVRSHYDRKHKRLYILEEMYEYGLTNIDLAKEVKSIVGSEVIVFDSSEPKSITELNVHGVLAVPAFKGKDSIKFGIQWLQQQEIIIDVSCQRTKNEFQSYKWREDKDGNVLPEPVDRNNHCIDALRYSVNDEVFLKYQEQPKGRGKPSMWDDDEKTNKWMVL